MIGRAEREYAERFAAEVAAAGAEQQDPRRRAYLARLAKLADAKAEKWPAGSGRKWPAR